MVTTLIQYLFCQLSWLRLKSGNKGKLYLNTEEIHAGKVVEGYLVPLVLRLCDMSIAELFSHGKQTVHQVQISKCME